MTIDCCEGEMQLVRNIIFKVQCTPTTLGLEGPGRRKKTVNVVKSIVVKVKSYEKWIQL